MPSLQTARRIANAKTNNAKTLGQIYKEESDFLMEETWDNSITSTTCYIYDHFHDDFFTDEHGITRSLAEGMTYENTNKTKIDAKFIIKSYQSMDKDQVEYYLMFRPSQPVRFNEGDDLYYYETDFRKRYSATFPIGLWVDLPDDRGVYHKWLICRNEPANQFPKYLILPANYELMWAEKFWYTDDDSKNMRVIVSALMENPTVWKITKCESASPLGLQKLTLYTNFFNEHTDYVNFETGEMYANYFDSEIAPTDPSTPTTPPSSITTRISASTSTIKVGGSYKNLTVNLFNDSNEDITTEYADATFTWTCSIDNEDWTDKVSWRAGTEYNQKKVKFPNDTSTIGKILSVKCEIIKNNLPIESEILPLELTE